MKRKWIIASVLILAEILVCVGIVFAAWAGFRGLVDGDIRVRMFHIDRAHAEADEEWQFTVDSPATLVVESGKGNIQVTGSDSNEIVVTAHKTAWDSNTSQAEAALSEMKVVIAQDGNTVTVKYIPDSKLTIIGSIRNDTVDFTIAVPTETSVQVKAGHGKVSLSDTLGAADLSSSSGKINITDVVGSLDARTHSGNISAQRIQAKDGNVNLHTDFGDISLEDTSAENIDISTNSGAVGLRDVTATGSVTLGSDFGNIGFESGSAGRITADTNSGKVRLTGLTVAGDITARSDFGDITLMQVCAASYDLDTNSGEVSVTGASGTIKAHSDFGAIVIIAAEDADIDLTTNSGGIEFEGSLGAGPHILTTDFGNINISLPDDTALNFDFETDHGEIESEFPIMLTGKVEEDHWCGTINGGGASLNVKTSSGNIRLEIINP